MSSNIIADVVPEEISKKEYIDYLKVDQYKFSFFQVTSNEFQHNSRRCDARGNLQKNYIDNLKVDQYPYQIL